jgi:hypothetical protein
VGEALAKLTESPAWGPFLLVLLMLGFWYVRREANRDKADLKGQINGVGRKARATVEYLYEQTEDKENRKRLSDIQK